MKRLTRAQQKALRPTQILDAAFEEFVEHGFSAARVEDIADRVGVTKGTVYVYFPTKEDLFAAMIEHISVPIQKMIADTQALTGTCVERLTAMMKLFYKISVDQREVRELLRFVISEGRRFPKVIDSHRDDLVDPLLMRVQTILNDGIASGEFVAGPRAEAQLVFAPILAMIFETLIHDGRRELDISAYIEAHLDLVLGSLVNKDGQPSEAG
ncbi:AcrR family transcriptional regulator [Rhizobium skierniewicense]|uniref:AcrR family transcriptional regulator n=1 Tax=Rhizobium skierniewicense TaxID=984260 RepID=A0A7W6C5T1_9HYPH|nr:TetR/AcrR family transcriptional regulator [Rhizobium skierniewicense]MBB3945341.1 AcrR family transcriptional regulator [Rhizobium skierniewicense]